MHDVANVRVTFDITFNSRCTPNGNPDTTGSTSKRSPSLRNPTQIKHDYISTTDCISIDIISCMSAADNSLFGITVLRSSQVDY